MQIFFAINFNSDSNRFSDGSEINFQNWLSKMCNLILHLLRNLAEQKRVNWRMN